MSEIDIFSHAPVAMAVVSRDGQLLRVNGALCDLVGYSAGELVGRTLPSLSHPDETGRAAAELRKLLDDGSLQIQLEQHYVHSSGRSLWVLLSVSIVRGAAGEPLSFIAHLQDFSGRDDVAQRIAFMADHDALTGLATRHRFEEALAHHRHEMSRYGAHGVLLLLDLDRFKPVNDKYGHQAGDDLLRAIAAVLRARVRESDVLARLGGDEFSLLLPHTDLEQAQVVAGDIVRVIGETEVVSGKATVRLTASIGLVALANSTGQDPVALADAAMYRAKRAGGNRWMSQLTIDEARRRWPGLRPNAFIRSSARQIFSSRKRQAAIGFAAALLVTARYRYANARRLGAAPRSLATSVTRALASIFATNRVSARF